MPIDFQVVDVGSAPNDKQGNKGRNAFIKVNENFALAAGAIEDAERKAYVVPITGEEEVVEAGKFVKYRIPYAFVLMEVRASVNVEESTDDIVIDITENGASIFASGESLVIPSGSDTSVGYSPAPNVEYTIFEDNSWIEISVGQAASGGTAEGLKVYLIGYVIWTTF